MTDLLGFRPSDLGAAVLVGITVLAILRGYLVPRSVVDDVRKDRDARIADRDSRIAELAGERDTWRKAHEVSEEARREAQDQAGELLELSRLATHFFGALPRAAAGEVKADADVDQASTAPPPP